MASSSVLVALFLVLVMINPESTKNLYDIVQTFIAQNFSTYLVWTVTFIMLGLGASQMASGLNYLFGINASPMMKLLLILFVSTIATVSAVMLVVTWFVTSSDSGTLVICTMICLGKTRPPALLRIYRGLVIALVAGLLLLAGGLKALQAASTAIALPFSLILLLMFPGFLKSLWQTERSVFAT